MNIHFPEYATADELAQCLKDMGYDNLSFHIQGVSIDQRIAGNQFEIHIVGNGFIPNEKEQLKLNPLDEDFDRAMKGIE